LLLGTGLLSAAEEIIVLSGKLETVACTAACSTCCTGLLLTDTSGNHSLGIGNSIVDLSKIRDDDKVHQFSGYYYDTTGQCGMGECSKFAIVSVDASFAPAAVYNPENGRLSIQSVVISGQESTPYRVKLSEPFAIDSAIEHSNLVTVPQAGDCSAENAQCALGTSCVSYYGIAGPSGPEFKSCEIPCSQPGATCPTGQSCVTIADGPGAVCRVD
jgi:hypothetical protein